MKNGKQFLIVFGLALLTTWVAYDAVVHRVVRAQSSVATEIRAQRFVLVNENGETGGIFSSDSRAGGQVQLYWKGQQIFSAGGPIMHPLANAAPAQSAAATEIRAQRFVLVNEKGEVGGVIGFDEQGAGTIRLYRNGQQIFYAGHTRYGVVAPLATSNPGNEIRAQQFTLTNEKGMPVGIVGFDKQGNPAMALYDNHQETYRVGTNVAVPLE